MRRLPRVDQAAATAGAAHGALPGQCAVPAGPLRAGGVPCLAGLATVFTAVLLDSVGGCLQLYVMSLHFLVTS